VFDMLVRRGDETLKCQATLVANLEPYRCPVLGILPERGKLPDAGVLVRLTVPGTPAARAGIVPGDRVVSLEGEPVADAADLRSRIARRKPADKLSLEVVNGKDRREIDLVLASAATTLPDGLPVPSVDPDAAPGREVPLKLPQWKNNVAAYLPKAYSTESQHGLLVWMRCVTDEQATLDLWKKHADSHGMVIVLIDPSSSERWLPGEAELIRDVLRLCKKKFSLDSNRIGVGGQAGGGALAYRTATRERDGLSGCIVFDARLSGPQITDRPESRFGLLIGRSDKGTLTDRLDRAAKLLRKGGLPVTVVPHEGAADRLNDGDVAAITQWIDLLDQI
jgi:hypothetical protein